MQNEPIEVTLKVTDVFEKSGIPYRIAGSLASTSEVDVLYAENPEQVHTEEK